MIKRAKDVTYTNKLVTERGIMDVKSVSTDTEAETTLISTDGDTLIFGLYEKVETLDA